jgi:MFS transporter, ACS family, hexuronate transporter
MTDVEQSQEEQREEQWAAETQAAGGAWKWWMAGVLFLATVLTYLDRQTLSICEKQIREEFQLNDEQYGNLLAAFRWAYGLMQLPAGLMADRMPLRTTFGLAVGLWSLAGAAAAFVVRMPVLMVTRAVLGMGESFNWPCSSRIVANTFPPADRSLASGIFNSGAALGSVISPVVIGGIAMRYGWRSAFLAMGVLGAVWLVIWFAATIRRSPCHAVVRPKLNISLWGQCSYAAAFVAVGAGLPAIVILLGPGCLQALQAAFQVASAAWLAIRFTIIVTLSIILAATIVWSLVRWRSRAVGFWMLMIVSMTVNPCWYFMNEWLVKSLREDRGLDKVQIGGVAWTLVILTIIMLTADLGNLISGGFIKYLIRRGWSLRAARGTAMCAAACAIAPVALASYVDSLVVATAMFGLAGMGITAIIASFTACQQDLSFRRVGLMSGFVGMVANIVSAIANPAIGAHHDATHSYRLMFILLGLLPLVSVAAILVFDAVVQSKAPARSGA